MRSFRIGRFGFLIFGFIVGSALSQFSNGGGGGGGGGTVTNTGTLTANAVIKGNGGVDVTASGCSIDGSNNVSCPGTVSTGVGSGTTGALDLIESTSGFKTTISPAVLTADRAITQEDVAGIMALRDASFANNDCTKYSAGVFVSTGAPCGSGGGGATVSFGTFSGLPGTCSTNDLYFPTDSYYSVFVCTAANTQNPFLDGKQLKLPTAASTWTLVNGSSGTATKTDSKGAVLLSTTSDVAGVEAILKAVPSAPYVKTMLYSAWAIDGQSPGGSDGIRCGVLWTNGTATSSSLQMMGYLALGSLPTTNLQVAHFTSFAYAGQTTDYLGQYPLFFGANRIWMQLEDDNTTRFFRLSSDGTNWNTVFSVARTSPFTPTHYGMFCGQQGGTGTSIGQPFSAALLSDN